MEMKYNEVLRQLRKDRDKTIEEVATQLEMSKDRYGKYERGERQPDIDTLIALADYYKVSLDYLTGRYQKEKD